MSYIDMDDWLRNDVKRRVQEFEKSMTLEELKQKICLNICDCRRAIIQAESIYEKHPEFNTGDLIEGRGLYLYTLYLALECVERVERRESRKEYYNYDRDR